LSGGGIPSIFQDRRNRPCGWNSSAVRDYFYFIRGNERSLNIGQSIPVVAVSFFERQPLKYADANGNGSGNTYSDSGPYYRVAKGAFLILCRGLFCSFGVVRVYNSSNEDRQKRSDGGKERLCAFVTACAIIVGWIAGIYGAALILSATEELASLNRRSESVIVKAAIIVELELSDIERKVLGTAFVKRVDDTPLENAPTIGRSAQHNPPLIDVVS
jgi:hypothetical protein